MPLYPTLKHKNKALGGDMVRKLPRFLTEKEIAVMFHVSRKNKRDNMLLKCMYFLGLRNSEVQKMQIEDIDLVNENIKVVSGKGEKDRYVPIPKGFIKELRGWIGKRRGGPLFPGRSNGLISNRHIRRIVKKYAKLANVRKYDEIHPHTLRHSYATHLQNSGVPLNAIQAVLGHENIETTAIYTHMSVEKAREYINKAFGEFR